MAGLWRDLLGFEGIGAHDDFFSLGGHSLLATQLIARVQDEFGVGVSLNAVFDDPTVAGMAQKVAALRADAHAEPPAAIPVVPRTGPLPLSFHQERLWVLDRLEPGSPMYNVPVGSWLRGPVDVAAARRALAEIVRRHEVFRTVYLETDAGPVQVVRPHVEVPLPVDDLTAVPEAERLRVVRLRLTEEARRPLDLVDGPVLRARLLRLDAGLHALLVTFHHIVMDGWSGGVFFHEWTALYGAFMAGEALAAPGAARPVRGLRGLAAGAALGRAPGAAPRLLAGEPARGAPRAGAPDGPAAPPGAELPRRAVRGGAGAGAGGARPRAGPPRAHHLPRGACRRLPGALLPLHRAGGLRRGIGGRQPPARDAGAHRLLHQHHPRPRPPLRPPPLRGGGGAGQDLHGGVRTRTRRCRSR